MYKLKITIEKKIIFLEKPDLFFLLFYMSKDIKKSLYNV